MENQCYYSVNFVKNFWIDQQNSENLPLPSPNVQRIYIGHRFCPSWIWSLVLTELVIDDNYDEKAEIKFESMKSAFHRAFKSLFLFIKLIILRMRSLLSFLGINLKSNFSIKNPFYQTRYVYKKFLLRMPNKNFQ